MAVEEQDMDVARYMLGHGTDVNYSEPDMVCSYAATPLAVAVRNDDTEIAKRCMDDGLRSIRREAGKCGKGFGLILRLCLNQNDDMGYGSAAALYVMERRKHELFKYRNKNEIERNPNGTAFVRQRV